MKQLIKLGLIIAGTAALSTTMASANCGSGKDKPKEMKCQSGKCGAADKKEMKCNGSKDMKKNMNDKAPKQGKCGEGKCGSK